MPGFTSAPSIIVGIGGTGLKAVTLIKKSIMEANQNQVPLNLSFLVVDTEEDIKYRAGGWGESRNGTRATGPVAVDGAGEYVPITGNVRKVADELMHEQIDAEANPSSRRDQPHRHMTQWFQAKYYLTQYKVDDLVWNLSVGAGRLRQFGRLGLFSRQKLVADKLRNSLQGIRSTGANQVFVHVIGSLAGGTGSSLYADIAHLVSRMSERVGFTQLPAIFGHFVLTEAFRGTPQVQLSQSGVKTDFDARAYAGIREIIRLQGITPDVPYPMTYDPRGTGELSARLEKSPYNNVYLYDGQRRANPLGDKLIEDGIAPTIADAVLSYVDSKSAGAFVSHSVNFKSFYGAFDIPPAQVAFGSIGTYTIELPIYHITEGWSHALARQALDVLLDPVDRDTTSGVPLSLAPNRPGGKARDVNDDLTQWLQTSATKLIAEFVDWGRKAQKSDLIRRQTTEDVLKLDAARWQELLAPTDPAWQDLVTNAQAELGASLADKLDKRYYVLPDPLGNSNEQRATNLRETVEQSLQTMVGRTATVWQRDGGEFRKALLRLAVNHDQVYRKSLSDWLKGTLNGNADASDSVTRKGGKLGYAIAFIDLLRETLREAYRVLDLAATAGNTERRAQWDALSADLSELLSELNAKGGGLFKARYKDYVNKANELAQFHKADIARVVAYDLLRSLQVVADQARNDLALWVRALALAPSANGGAYALVARGQDQLSADRRAASNAVRWVIADDEPGDKYLAEKRDALSAGNEALNRILDSIVWKVGLTDGKGSLTVDFALRDAPATPNAAAVEHLWNRQAGEKDKLREGEASITWLLNACRKVYEDAWTSTSVADYLAANYATGRTDKLAQLVFARFGIPLATTRQDDAPMKTTYMRVKQESNTDTKRFLTTLLQEFRVLTGHLNSVQAQQAQEAGQAKARELGMNIPTGESGYDSHDPFKISFILFGDLIQPSEVVGFSGSQSAYHNISAQAQMWRTLHIFAAETNALEVELGLSSGEQRFVQRRRELVDDVTRILEDMDAFELAMRCLAYGETDYDWGVDNQRGLLLHSHSPRGLENQAGNKYWRLQTMPSGKVGSDGRVRTPDGRMAHPIDYQLSDLVRTPDLLRAFVQFTVQKKDKRHGTEIDFAQVEETLRRVMTEHRAKWMDRASQIWTLQPHVRRDAYLRDEVADKAAQIIRLNAFVGRANDELAKHEWAWRPRGRAPASMVPQQILTIQAYVDLWSALRAVALREMGNLNGRFLELADWTAGIPDEAVKITADIPDTTEDATDTSQNPSGVPVDAVPGGRMTPDVEGVGGRLGLEAELAELKQKKADGYFDDAEYQIEHAQVIQKYEHVSRVNAISPVQPAKSHPGDQALPLAGAVPSISLAGATLADLEAKIEQLEKRNMGGDLSPKEYMRQKLQLEDERAALTKSAAGSESVAQQLKRLEEENRAGDLSPKEFARRKAELEAKLPSGADAAAIAQAQDQLAQLEASNSAGDLSPNQYRSQKRELLQKLNALLGRV